MRIAFSGRNPLATPAEDREGLEWPWPARASSVSGRDDPELQIWPGRHDLPLAQRWRYPDLVERVAAGAGG